MFWITIFGSGNAERNTHEYLQAEALGRFIAQKEWIVCTGGYGGIMEAVSKGAVESGGKVIGITTEWFPKRTPNAYITKNLRAPTYLQRLEKLFLLSDAYITFPGRLGTFLELVTFFTFSDRKFLTDRPLLLFGNYWTELFHVLSRQFPEISQMPIVIVQTPEECITHLEKWFAAAPSLSQHKSEN